MGDKDETIRMFHAYIRDALKNACLNFLRHRKYVSKHEICSADLSEYEEGVEDEYAFLEHHIRIMDVDLMIKNDLLYEALSEMKQRNRDILILSYGYRWSDRKIGEKLHLSRSKVQRLKKQYFEELKERMGVTETKLSDMENDTHKSRQEVLCETKKKTDI